MKRINFESDKKMNFTQKNIYTIKISLYYLCLGKQEIYRLLEIKIRVEEKHKKFNMTNYNNLYNERTNEITWYSDKTSHVVANIVRIKELLIYLE